LSKAKDPRNVQPFLKKVFENMNEVEFIEGNKIVSMYSVENEKVDFVRPLETNNKNVEDWLCELEGMMM
jgi:dynein heavy chain